MIRRPLVIGLALAAPATAITGWYATRAITVAHRLEEVRAAFLRVSPEGLARDDPAAWVALRRAREQAAEARRITDGPSWTALTHAPLAGRAAGAVRDLAVAAEVLSAGVVPDLLRVRTALATSGGNVPLAMTAAAGSLQDAERRLAGLRAALAAHRGGTGVGALDQAVAAAGRQAEKLELATGAARALPGLMGAAGKPRRYFLALQTSAEARGTGGLVGAYGILAADRGRLRVERLEPNNTLRPEAAPVADLGTEFRRRYGYLGAASELSAANLSPHFPYAARIWTSLWHRRTGQRLDGAVATDPTGLAELLKVLGPVQVSGGQTITAGNAVDLIERVAYARYPDPAIRKRFLIQVAAAVADAAFEHRQQPVDLARALLRMASTGRLQLWSEHGDEQALLARSPLGGVLPDRPGPYAQLVVNNAGGNKLDHYLERAVTYELGPCRKAQRDTVVRVRLTNTAPASGLPGYVTQRADKRGAYVRGSNRLWVSLYAAQGARLTGATQDGKATRIATSRERTHPVFDALPELLPGQSTVLEYHLTEPRTGGAPVVPVQPLTRPQATVIRSTCT